MKRFLSIFALFIFLSITSTSAMAANFESKVVQDYESYVKTFNLYLSSVEKTGKIDYQPSNQIERAVYTIVNEFQPAAYYRWIRMRSFQIPSGATVNFENIDMRYISKNIFDRYKSTDDVENISLAAFMVYAVDSLYTQSVGQTDFPDSSTFNEAIFALNNKVSNDAANITRNYIQKALGASGTVTGNYSSESIDLKKIVLSSVSKAYDGKIPSDVIDAIENYQVKLPDISPVNPDQYVADLVNQALTASDVDGAIKSFETNMTRAVDNSVRTFKIFMSTQSTETAVGNLMKSVVSSIQIQEMLAANTVKGNVSRAFNNRMFRLEGTLAGKSSEGTSPITWRWLVYAVVLIFFGIYRKKLFKYAFLGILVFESISILFFVDPMLNRFDSTVYGFLVVTTAILAILSLLGIFKTRNFLKIFSTSLVVAAFAVVLFVPLYVNLPSTRMSENHEFLGSVYSKLYSQELYGSDGIITYDLNNLSSNLTALRLAPYNFTTQTLSSYLTTLKKAGAYKEVLQYPNSLRVEADRNSEYFGLDNVKNFSNSIDIIQSRANAMLEDVQNRLGSISSQKVTLSDTLKGIYSLSAPSFRNDITKAIDEKVSSGNLSEISTSIANIVKTADALPQKAPNIQFFQTSGGSRLFILISFLLITVTLFRKDWLYRFVMSVITIFGAVVLLYPKSIEIFVEYGFPTYSHILQKNEGPNVWVIWFVMLVGVLIVFEALITRFSKNKG